MPYPNPVLIDMPVPIRTPRLLIRPKQIGDGANASAAIAETWDDLHRWMRWADDPAAFNPEMMEVRTRQAMARFILREDVQLIGIDSATGVQVITCGLHRFDWQGRLCDIGYWVRKSAQGKGFATEAANALVRYAFGALGMQRVILTCAAENEASRRIAERLNFTFEGRQRGAEILPEGKDTDRLCYARLDTANLPKLDVYW
jgi:RimJ/RimL family protein N-acetyltransferase